ncbi:spermatogenesis-associated protein 31D3-like [Artibeus jamaicensis]|uniref:spermatogenesis-associated protein 31D3-like n=1 Tax=Artibeus jamaicensis TaxID=9417 RepID=UPI00235A9EBC|nr:spermatogenesis-associated protein 31D3-like [Artibeus jamaicensis]XP_036986588.2 spermatogenesis-associated protein 31D3-like [Artibeus jamaicensis]XP_053512101.1 spermatogenesis-associated protein 31D3-like [Artibeus jamaicensis]XP_053512103.1 spermatogenesis-associated protein 31D3-like [Artibeus jamaicensis]
MGKQSPKELSATQVIRTTQFGTKCQCQCRPNRRGKGGKLKGWRYHQREEEEKRVLISMFKSPLGQRHDSTRFRQLLCPDPSCEVCNNATTEMDQLLLSMALEDSTPSGSPLPSSGPVTKPLFTEAPAFPAVPPGRLIPLLLPEAFPPRPSILCLNPRTPFHNLSVPSPLVHSLPPEPFPPLASKFLVDHSPPKPLDLLSLPSRNSLSAGAAVQSEDTLTLNTIFLDSSMTQDTNPLLQSLPQSQPLSLTQIKPQAHLQSPCPVLSSSPIRQIKGYGMYFHRFRNESDYLNSSHIQHLERNVLRKHQESLSGLPPMVQKSQKNIVI